jgi:hypothetical protein
MLYIEYTPHLDKGVPSESLDMLKFLLISLTTPWKPPVGARGDRHCWLCVLDGHDLVTVWVTEVVVATGLLVGVGLGGAIL